MPGDLAHEHETFRLADQVIIALNHNPSAPVDTDLIALLKLAATSPDVAAFIHRNAGRPGIQAAYEPPEGLILALGTIGLDWSKFFDLLPRLYAVRAILQRPGLPRDPHLISPDEVRRRNAWPWKPLVRNPNE